MGLIICVYVLRFKWSHECFKLLFSKIWLRWLFLKFYWDTNVFLRQSEWIILSQYGSEPYLVNLNIERFALKGWRG